MMTEEIGRAHRLLGGGSKNGGEGWDTCRIFVKVSIKLGGRLETWTL